ncbi:MAG: EAL domain-containing protein [Alphaproteobacteria bacterium]|nr:EAL domain-containing protein [Alphaproteobacteria bacterium]
MRQGSNRVHGRRMKRPRWLHPLATAAVVSLLYLAGILDPVERMLTDTRFELAGREASGDLVIVGIDPKSLRQLDTWPWPRDYHAAVIDRLVESGAVQIAIDVDLSSWSTPESDTALRDALAQAGGRVILPVFRQKAIDGANGMKFIHTAPIPEFRRLAQLASVNTMPEKDGLIRRHAMSNYWQDGYIPTMPAILAGHTRSLFDNFHIDYGIRPDTLPRLSYVDVFSGQFDPAIVRGKKVVIGATAVELGDQFAVPVYKALPGPIVQALIYETLVQNRALYRSAPWLVIAGILILAFGLGRRLRIWSWRRGLAVMASLSLSMLALSVVVQIWTPLMLEVTPWILVAVLLYGIALARRIDRQELILMLRGSRLRHTNALMRSVVETSSEAIMTVSEDLIIEMANPAAEAIFDSVDKGLVGRPLEKFFPKFQETGKFEACLAHGHRSIEFAGRRMDGSIFPVEATVDAMSVDGLNHYVVVARDVTERHAQQKLMEYLALHDTLTGLPNRTLLMDRLDHAISASRRDGKPLALLLLDLDRFKEINDTLGHAVGDSLLAEVGQILSEPLRESDTVARLGGDEFAILLPSVSSLAQARDIAERVAGVLARPFPVEGITVEVGVSIGVALYPDHGADASELMRGADVAMYVAKRNHMTVSIYDEDKDHHSVRNLSMSGELRQAMDADELVLFYQPQIDVATGKLVGAEALLRWDHPHHGMVSPDEFVSLAEQTGLIRPLTRWVIGKALKQVSQWQERGLDIGLSINLSPRNLHEEGLAKSIGELMEKRGLRPELITLEITEDAIMTDPERALAAIRHLKDCGVRLAIDDFGTGYSSLAYLKALPVDELKIDKSFVMQMADDTNDEVIVRSTIDLAHNLGLSVVAEGVESELHLQTLRGLGCDIGQGFHIGRPLRIEEFYQWMENFNTISSGAGGIVHIHPGARGAGRKKGITR